MESLSCRSDIEVLPILAEQLSDVAPFFCAQQDVPTQLGGKMHFKSTRMDDNG